MEYKIVVVGEVDDEADPEAEDEVLSAAQDFVKQLGSVSTAVFNSMNFNDVDLKDDEEEVDTAPPASEPAPAPSDPATSEAPSTPEPVQEDGEN
jgi:hypothetical protein